MFNHATNSPTLLTMLHKVVFVIIKYCRCIWEFGWVIDCCLTPWLRKFAAYHCENKLNVDEMVIISVLYKTNVLRWIVIMQGHWNNSPWEGVSLHSNTFSWSRAIHSLLLLLIAIYWSGKPRFTTLDASTLSITPPIHTTSTKII